MPPLKVFESSLKDKVLKKLKTAKTGVYEKYCTRDLLM